MPQDKLSIHCAECDSDFESEYGGTHQCPECDSEGTQQYMSGFVGVEGPMTINGWA